MEFKITLLPWLAFFLLVIVFIFSIVGAASDDKGWAANDTIQVGWKKQTIDLPRGKDRIDLVGDLDDAGKAAVAGAVFCILLSFVAAPVCFVRGFGFGPKWLSFVAAGICAVAAFLSLICWASWAGISQNDRDDAELDADYAFALAILANIGLVLASVIMGVSFFWDWSIYSTN
ncbi:hypothetical protein QOT17_013628 [Balamuthia mandrillaris]